VQSRRADKRFVLTALSSAGTPAKWQFAGAASGEAAPPPHSGLRRGSAQRRHVVARKQLARMVASAADQVTFRTLAQAAVVASAGRRDRSTAGVVTRSG
jgi:hypothetical protein